jgi:uncharacterized protein DUF4339
MNSKEKRWHLSREGKQHGPFSDTDLATFAELGQLQPSDLVWREGFANWRPAVTIFPPPEPTPTPAGARKESTPTPARMQSAASKAIYDERRSMLQSTYRGPTWKIALIALACSATIGYAFRVYVTNTLLTQVWGPQ